MGASSSSYSKLPTNMAPHNSAPCRVCVLFLLLSIATLSSASDSSSSLCTIPSPPPRHHPIGINESLPLLRSFQLNAGSFFGGEDLHFAKGDDPNASYYDATRSFSLFPHSVQGTDDPELLHVSATLTLSGGRTRRAVRRRRRRHGYVYAGDHVVTFHLEGYYSHTSAELCMAGSGTYSDSDDDGAIKNLAGAVLRLRVPSPPSLFDPFATGSFRGDGFSAISLVAYADGDNYKYGDATASCPPPSAEKGAVEALGPNFTCAHLKKQLVTLYKVRNDDGADASSSNGGGGAASPLLGLRPWRGWNRTSMHVGQVRCTDDGAAVRAYATFSNDTAAEAWWPPRRGFVVEEEAVVAEGRWDPARRMLCLRACRVVRSGTTTTPSLEVQRKECGVGMGFWFPSFWTMRDRSAVSGVLWNSSQAAGGGKDVAGVISVSSIGDAADRSDFSDVKYRYNDSMIEEATKHYLAYKKNVKRPFQAPNYTHHDFGFHFYEIRGMNGHGQAYPVTIGSALVYGDRLAADASFSRGGAVVDGKLDLLNVSYDIQQYLPPAGWVRPTNVTSYSVPMEAYQITAEGVFDPKSGILCMVGCREHYGSTDCRALITVQFASLDDRAWGHGVGEIKSLRDSTDHLFFKKMSIRLYGMYSEQVYEAVSRMDLESVMLVVSTTLPCVFTVLQILHTKRHPEAAAATSITMLVVLALGYVFPLVIASEALFLSRRRYYVPFLDKVPYELSQAMLRAPTLIAFVLQLRLIQLALSGRKSAALDPTRVETSSAAEKRALWVCLPLYALGGAVTVVAHVMSGRAAGEEDSLAVVGVGPEPPTMWQDLVSSAGLALDAFLLPQVVMNAFSWRGGAAGVRAVSPWLYAGVTVVRAMPHVYDVVRSQGYVRSRRPSYVDAGPRDDRFGAAWDVAVPCVTAVLAVLVFLQQRKRRGAGAFLLRPQRSGGYEMVSTI
ncbi:hypothetical protein ACP4OV_024903 [Aristida adscensionis]